MCVQFIGMAPGSDSIFLENQVFDTFMLLAKWALPHEPTKQKADICRELAKNPRDDSSICRVENCDEKWVPFAIRTNKANTSIHQMAESEGKHDRFT